jgi:hypothetical protein
MNMNNEEQVVDCCSTSAPEYKGVEIPDNEPNEDLPTDPDLGRPLTGRALWERNRKLVFDGS